MSLKKKLFWCGVGALGIFGAIVAIASDMADDNQPSGYPDY
jgi:hypothetical protein